jgi:predicted TIM-barrel fold metal-dependent hydrolase
MISRNASLPIGRQLFTTDLSSYFQYAVLEVMMSSNFKTHSSVRLATMVLDVHTHIGSYDRAEDGITRYQPSDPPVDYQQRVETMNENGIDEAIPLPGPQYDRSQGAAGTSKLNDAMKRITERHERFVGPVGIVEPTHGENAIDELHRLNEEGFVGVMFQHQMQGVALDAPPSVECLKTADELGLVPFIHCYSPEYPYEHLNKLDHVAHIFDNPAIIIDTLASYFTTSGSNQVVELGQEYETLYFETSLMFSLGRLVEQLVAELGADRLLFGSDFATRPLTYRQSADLFQVKTAHITEDERERILERNAHRILDI